MIDPRELRIGNLVNYKSDISGQIKVIEVDWEFFSLDYYPKYSSPIEITEEWLVKLGYYISEEFLAWGRKTKRTHINITDELYICKYEGGWQLAICREDEAVPTAIESKVVKYVHQLQNLIFSLTGEELEFKI